MNHSSGTGKSERDFAPRSFPFRLKPISFGIPDATASPHSGFRLPGLPDSSFPLPPIQAHGIASHRFLLYSFRIGPASFPSRKWRSGFFPNERKNIMLTPSRFFRCSFAAMAFLLLFLSLAPEAQAANDAWLKTKLITTYGLNEHLSPFDIDVQVHDGSVTLSGEVETGIEKDLAGQIARSVEGVSSVQNNIAVVGNSNQERQPSAFYQSVTDATLTAKVDESRRAGIRRASRARPSRPSRTSTP